MSLASNIGGEELGQETPMTKVGVAAFIGALVAAQTSGAGQPA